MNVDLLVAFYEGLLTSKLHAARPFDSDQGGGVAESVDKQKMSDWRGACLKAGPVKRIRQLRWLADLSQHHLAEAVGVRFQQIQKYESGANRISASRLWSVAAALNVDIEVF